jgi:integrase
MSFAERLDYRQPYSNPCRGIERFKESRRKRPLNMKELAALWRHLDSMEATENPYIIGAFRLLLLTGMRREEVLTLRWADVDKDAGMIRLADAKTGPRVVILSREALAGLNRLPRVNGNPYVFPGLKEGQHLVNISDTWQVIRTTLGFPDVRIHDLRHTVATVLARTSPLRRS